MTKDIFTLKNMEYGIPSLPENPKVAMAYVPFQNENKLYDTEKGLSVGTMFPILDKPFSGRGVVQR